MRRVALCYEFIHHFPSCLLLEKISKVILEETHFYGFGKVMEMNEFNSQTAHNRVKYGYISYKYY